MPLYVNGQEMKCFVNGQQMSGYVDGVKMFGKAREPLRPQKRIAYENGSRTVQWKDETGAIILPTFASCIGSKETGILYYYLSSTRTIYRQDLTDESVTAIPLVNLANNTDEVLLFSVREDGLALYYSSNAMWVSQNIDTEPFELLAPTTITPYLSPSSQSLKWYNNKLLLGKTLYDYDMSPITILDHPDFPARLDLHQFGDTQTGYYVSPFLANYPSACWGKVYKVEADYSLTEIMAVAETPLLWSGPTRNVLYDAWNNQAIIGSTDGVGAIILATKDGINFTRLTDGGIYNLWEGSMDNQLGISRSWRTGYKVVTRDTFDPTVNNSLFPGYLGISNSLDFRYSSLNEHVFVNTTLLWDIVDVAI